MNPFEFDPVFRIFELDLYALRQRQRVFKYFFVACTLDKRRLVAVFFLMTSVFVVHIRYGENIVGKNVYRYCIIEFAVVHTALIAFLFYVFGENIPISVVSERPVFYFDGYALVFRRSKDQIIAAVPVAILYVCHSNRF